MLYIKFNKKSLKKEKKFIYIIFANICKYSEINIHSE